MFAPTAAAPALDDHRLTAPTFRIRPLHPDDARLLDSLLAGMSDRSRYQRFHSPKPRLTEADRASLSNVDGRDRFGLVALAADGTPLGAVHAVRLRDEAAAAEIGVAVADACQGQGLGTELVSRIARRGAAVGIERLIARVLAESGLQKTMTRHGWRPIAREGHVLTLHVPAWRAALSSRARGSAGARSACAPRGGGATSAAPG